VHEMRPGWDVWPKLQTDISASVPPQPTVLQAKATLRAQRPQIVIDSQAAEYRPSMADILAMNENDFKNLADAQGGGGGGYVSVRGGSPEASATDAGSAGPAVRGFLVRVHCTTPNVGGSAFVQQTMVNKLLELTSKRAIDLKMPYYVAKATVATETRVKDDQTRASMLAAGAGSGAANYGAAPAPMYGGGGAGVEGGVRGFGHGGGVRGFEGRGYRGGMRVYTPPPPPPPSAVRGATTSQTQPGEAEQPLPFADPQTGEDMSNDASLTVLIAVVLDPATAAAALANSATGGGTASDTGGAAGSPPVQQQPAAPTTPTPQTPPNVAPPRRLPARGPGSSS
jgi:hypothetical protein